jgi:hypothetical protein
MGLLRLSLNELQNVSSQRRKGAKKILRNAAALCAFAPLREKTFFLPVQTRSDPPLPN